MTPACRARLRRHQSTRWLAVFLVGCSVGSARAQEAGLVEAINEGATSPEARLFFPWVPSIYSPAAETLPEVDVGERFDAFERNFAAAFGEKVRNREGTGQPDLATRIGERLLARFEGSRLFGWYRSAEALYERFERLHRRIEGSTRWTRNGFAVDTDVESVVDGSVKLHVERRIRGFKVGFDVHDATEGRLGLRLGGVLRGYQINVDLVDIGSGELRLGVKKRLE